MKNYFGIVKTAAAALGLLLFAACMNPVLTPRPKEEVVFAEGQGVVRIGTGAGAARTAIPEAVFHRYEYFFSKDGGASVPKTPAGADAVFALDPGTWRVTVKAFMGDGAATLAAQGEEDFSITGGEETEVRVRLHPVTGEGRGTLNYTLTYPATATVSAFTLTLLMDETDTDLTNGAVTDGTSHTGTVTPVSGYYLARASLVKEGIPREKTEVVHIYKNMTTALELEFVDDDFKAIVVVSSADSGPGTLRAALEAVKTAGGAIAIDLPANDRVITLSSDLPAITKSVVIEGGGATLTRNGFTPSSTTQLLRITGAAVEVRISRLHFKGGRATTNGGAINNAGKLSLESCIFSDNTTNNGSSNTLGGAVYTSGTGSSLTVSGCTFYGNRAAGSSSNSGGAIYQASGTLKLTGNVFWESTGGSYPVVQAAGGTATSGGFNVSQSSSSGWTFSNGDKRAYSLPVSSVSLRPIGGGEAISVIAARPAGYPVTDFYGDPIPESNAAAGAIQTATGTGGYILNYAPTGPGTVTVTSGTVDADGLSSGDVTLTASPDGNGIFRYWTLGGTMQGEQTTQFTVNMDAHKTVRAVFYIQVTSAGDTGPGSLRETLDMAADGTGIVLPAGQTITLSTALPAINKSMVIEGNGATLTPSGTSFSGGFLSITGGAAAEVRISRLRFKGGAINNSGRLTLESCIFSDNTSTSSAGAVYTSGSDGSLIVSGCTFYGNRGTYGGAIYQSTGGGSLKLTGNIFWGNTGTRVVYKESGTVTSGGFNVSDKAGNTGTGGSGWGFTNGDKRATSPVVSSVSFRPIGGGEAISVIAARPAGYPVTDFYGDPIPEVGAAAGAAQTATQAGGYILNYAPTGPGTITVTSGTVDADGVSSGTVTLTASPAGNGVFRYWILDGTKQGEQATPTQFTVNMDAHKTVRAMFYTQVTSTGNTGPGSLREILAAVNSGEGIVLPSGQTITLNTALPAIAKSIVIEGNGATLQNGITPGQGSRLLTISSGAEVTISRLHFKGGKVINPSGSGAYGGAIHNSGNLTLESCIFSDNTVSQSNACQGGAIYASSGSLTVSGCTFYGNSTATPSTSSGGGAIYLLSGTLTLTGNVFWGNTGGSYPVVRRSSGTLTSSGFNVSDQVTGTSGWSFTNGDKQAPSLPVSPFSFKLIGGGSAAAGVITARPANYPAKDFYGDPIPETGAAAGAAQMATQAGGFILNYAPTGPGTVTVTSGTVDADGVSSGNITLTASPFANGVFRYWILDGTKQGEQPNPTQFTVNMDAHKTVRAVFYTQVTSTDNTGPGSLLETLAAVDDGEGIVLPANQTITLTTVLPAITKSIVIEGNGATLTQSNITPNYNTQLLKIQGTTPEVRISRLHFKGARTTSTSQIDCSGGAISSGGKLTLESCIFSDNIIAKESKSIYGSAVSSSGVLTVSGCTFYENGTIEAIYNSGTATLTGNIFWSTANAKPASSTVSNGYNVSHRAGGTGTSASGWAFTTGDTQLTDLSFDAAFKPSSASNGLPAVPVSSLSGFPLLYFNGDSRGTTPGAMPAQQ
ncbi:MAG: right-handed parallel beta-helix repeat-containing protein [Treponema sp.]|jgi:hypothetical protein|nr:right-handed parallel beta-helix repeat-containing protein [Treponema sp.]